MLRITIDLIPFGKEENKQTISKIEIANTCQVTDKRNYVYRYDGEYREMNTGVFNQISGLVEHDRNKSVLSLLKTILINCKKKI